MALGVAPAYILATDFNPLDMKKTKRCRRVKTRRYKIYRAGGSYKAASILSNTRNNTLKKSFILFVIC
jgi:hypothetical protein